NNSTCLATFKSKFTDLTVTPKRTIRPHRNARHTTLRRDCFVPRGAQAGVTAAGSSFIWPPLPDRVVIASAILGTFDTRGGGRGGETYSQEHGQWHRVGSNCGPSLRNFACQINLNRFTLYSRTWVG